MKEDNKGTNEGDVDEEDEELTSDKKSKKKRSPPKKKKKGKKKMLASGMGKVNIPSDVFVKVLKK